MGEESDKPTVLIVDDESTITDLLAQMLSEDCVCSTSESAEAALEEIRCRHFDLVISDVNLGGMSGVEMVPSIQSISPGTVVMMISGADSVEAAIDALRLGVFDYIRKPFDYDQVLASVRRALAHRRSLLDKQRQQIELEKLVEQKTAQLNHLAHYDSLTGLANEAMFNAHLGQVLAGSALEQNTAVMLMCISNLRSVRDTIGHEAAIQILVETADRLRSAVNNETVARFEGDRFALSISQTDPESVVKAVNLLSHTLRPAFKVDGHEIYPNINFGISISPADGIDGQTLLRNAGAALSQAEANGTRYQFYSADIGARAVHRLTLENNLRRALELGELTVFYQPKLETRSHAITGMEALLRWNSTELGSIPPSVFIPVAESTDLIIQIGDWAFKTACEQAKSWLDQGFQLNVAVNVSARQFRDQDLSEKISATLDRTNFDPHLLTLEVTESSILTDLETAVEVLSRLQKLGISISIDDFGTGQSSLGYLRALPVDVLKIDKSFIKHMTTDSDSRVLVKTIITLAHDLGLRVVAEGVEIEEQLEHLRSMGCDEWQGYLHSKPMPADDFLRTLRTGNKP